jgi:hypothetical protein
VLEVQKRNDGLMTVTTQCGMLIAIVGIIFDASLRKHFSTLIDLIDLKQVIRAVVLQQQSSTFV